MSNQMTSKYDFYVIHRITSVIYKSTSLHVRRTCLAKMVYKKTIPEKIQAYVKFYRDEIAKGKMKKAGMVKWLSRKCKVSIPGVYRLLKEPLDKKICLPSSRKGIGE